MIKHICGQAIYQVAVLTVLIFAGDKFIPENLPDVTDANGKSIVYAPGGKYVRSGRLKYPFSFEDDYQTVIFFHSPYLLSHTISDFSRHMDLRAISLLFLIHSYSCKCSGSSQREELTIAGTSSKVCIKAVFSCLLWCLSR